MTTITNLEDFNNYIKSKYNYDTMKMRIKLGDDINDCYENAYYLSKVNNHIIYFIHNGFYCYITPDMKKEDLENLKI